MNYGFLGQFKLEILSVHHLNPFRQAFSKVMVVVVNRILGKGIMISREEDDRPTPVPTVIERFCKTTPPSLTRLRAVE
jgi:hypothetical protein